MVVEAEGEGDVERGGVVAQPILDSARAAPWTDPGGVEVAIPAALGLCGPLPPTLGVAAVVLVLANLTGRWRSATAMRAHSPR